MVYFVGAGPGAVDLITVRGKKLLEEADVVIYAGSLVNKELLNYTKDSCQICDSSSMTLEEVIETIKEHESNKSIIVRLHTGDPSVYGAIREQIDILSKIKINFECVPGVSSFLASAALLNAEYTLPNISQTVILTRVEGRTAVPKKEKLSLLASHQSSMVIFLSISMIDKVSKELIDGGYSEDTPCAIVYKASWPDEKKIITTIRDMSEKVKVNNIEKTALILIGDFLGNEYERSKLYDPAFSHGYRSGNS